MNFTLSLERLPDEVESEAAPAAPAALRCCSCRTTWQSTMLANCACASVPNDSPRSCMNLPRPAPVLSQPPAPPRVLRGRGCVPCRRGGAEAARAGQGGGALDQLAARGDGPTGRHTGLPSSFFGPARVPAPAAARSAHAAHASRWGLAAARTTATRGFPAAAAPRSRPLFEWTRRVRLVRGEGHGVST